MANTYTLIASNTLSSSAASVTFSAIPNTYTDLVLRISTRTSASAYLDPVDIRLNSDSNSVYSYTNLYGWYVSSNQAVSERQSNATYLNDISNVANNGTSNTFASTEIYIPNYLASANKPISSFGAAEGNFSTTDYSWQVKSAAYLWRNTAAITSIAITANQGSWNFLSGSSFFLYGIKSS